MILFFISLILIFLSAYAITSILCKNKDIEGFLYIPLIMFAQIVFNFEFLSLFKMIDKLPFFIMNILWLVFSYIILKKRKAQFWAPEFRHFFRRVFNSFRLYKSLILLTLAYFFFIYVALFLNIISPLANADAFDYHVARSAFWLVNKNLNHYFAADIRLFCFPINSELLYSWVILFTHKLVFLGMFSFVGYLMAIFSIFNILSDYCYRKRLWVILILSSLPSVIVQVTGTETDVLLAGLVLSSVFLFKKALQKNTKVNLYISSLAYALAIGTKTPSLFVIPSIGILFLILEYQKTHNFKFKNFLTFVMFGILNFVVFASYNYVLNFIDYGNIMGSASMMVVHKNCYGIKGAIANFIKHTVLLFDFTAFKWGKKATEIIIPLRDNILTVLHVNNIPDGLYSSPSEVLNMFLFEPRVGQGIIGIITFIPCLLVSLLVIIFIRTRKTYYLFLNTALFILSLFILSYCISFMTYNVRFMTFMMVIFSPIFIYSYNKNRIYKAFVIFFAVFYLTLFSTHIWARPYQKMAKCLFKDHESISLVRQRVLSENFQKDKKISLSTDQLLCKVLRLYGKNAKILAIFDSPHNYLYYAMLNLEGYHIDFKSPEILTVEMMKEYDYLVFKNVLYSATNLVNYDKNKLKYKLTNTGKDFEYLDKNNIFYHFYYF